MGFPIKSIDISKRKPIEISKGSLKGISFTTPAKQEKPLFDESRFNIGSIIFNLQDTCNKYGIRYDNVIVLIYLNELVVFNKNITVIDNLIKLRDYLLLGYIVKDFSYKKKDYYRLSKSAKEVIDYFYSTLKDNESIIKENNIMKLDVTSKVKSTLSDYFSS